MALGGGLAHVVGLAAATGLAAAVWWWRSGNPTSSGTEPPPPPGADAPGPRAAARMAGLAAAALAAGLAAEQQALGFWLAGSGLLAICALRELRAPVRPAAAEAPHARTAALLALAGLCVATSLLAHRPDADDAYLLNLAARAADAPFRPLFSGDTLHGLPGPPAGVPAGLPTYRLHSIELWVGAVAWLSPLRALEVAHLLVPAIAAFLVPLALGRLLRLLAPGRWLAACALSLLFLWGVGDAHLAYGNFAFVRLHQGKAIFVSLLLPLLAAFAIEFAWDPGPRRWCRLALAQIAALGLSATALWIAPTVTGLALLAARPWSRAALQTALLGACSSLYLVGAGLLVAADARRALLDYALQQDLGELAARTLTGVLGVGPAAWLVAFACLGGWALAPSPVGRRFAVVLPLGFLLLFWNPLSDAWLATRLTGVPTYWRVFWLLPAPALVGLALSAPLALAGPRWAGPALCAALGLLALVWAPERSTLAASNRVHWGLPGPKAPPELLAAAESLARHAEPGSPVLAPYRVATWVSTLHRAPVPLAVRPDYLLSLGARLGREEVRRRGRLVAWVSGSSLPAPGELSRAVADYGLRAVCLSSEAETGARRALADAGLRLAEVVPGYEIWSARSPGARASPGPTHPGDLAQPEPIDPNRGRRP